MAELVVLGLGNVLLSDDGLGVAAVTRLGRRFRAPDGVRVLDGGTLGLSLLPLLAEAQSAILVDAIAADAPPGAPVRIEGHEVRRAVGQRLSPHQIGVADLFDGLTLRGEGPTSVVLLGLVPRSIELGLGLSPEVAAGLDGLVEHVVEEARALGFAFEPRESHESDRADLGHVLGL
jgi:hydrogenase maturation protease